jgi:hypothetical protein
MVVSGVRIKWFTSWFPVFPNAAMEDPWAFWKDKMVWNPVAAPEPATMFPGTFSSSFTTSNTASVPQLLFTVHWQARLLSGCDMKTSPSEPSTSLNIIAGSWMLGVYLLVH